VIAAALAALALLMAAFWLGLALRLAGLRRRAPRLPAPPERPEAIPPTTILLPLRDEEANVVDCLRSLLAQLGRPAIRAIDDGSSDATPRLLAGIAASGQQLEVVAAEPLRPGLSGKVNALRTGFDRVTTEWVLLTDADTRHAPDLLARAHAAVDAARLDALSLAGVEEARGAGENLLTPAVYALLDLLLGDWAPHARGEARQAVANGQYFLVRSAALRAAGGFEALAGDPLDDVALARALRRAGFRTGFRRAGDALRVRMYRGTRETFRGWRRNLALIFGESPAIVASAAALAGATLTTIAGLALSGAALPLAVAWAGGALASAAIRRSAGNSALAGFLFPFDVSALAVTLALAAHDRRRGRLAAWKGRELPAPQPPSGAA